MSLAHFIISRLTWRLTIYDKKKPVETHFRQMGVKKEKGVGSGDGESLSD